MLDVNRGEVVEVLDVRLNAPVRHLRSSVYFVVLPSVQYRGMVAAFLSSFFLRQRPLHGLPATDCVHAFALLTELMLHDSMEFSKLENVALIRSIVF